MDDVMNHTNATHCNTLQHTATRCNTLQHIQLHMTVAMATVRRDEWCHASHHCNTLQHTATRCNTFNSRITSPRAKRDGCITFPRARRRDEWITPRHDQWFTSPPARCLRVTQMTTRLAMDWSNDGLDDSRDGCITSSPARRLRVTRTPVYTGVAVDEK